MSTHTASVVRLEKVYKHPNADSLDVVEIGGWSCRTRLGDFKPGDLGVFVEPDTLVPVDEQEFAFLAQVAEVKDGKARIKAKRLRGIASFGLLIHARPGWEEGHDAWGDLRLEHYEPPIRGANTSGEDASAPDVYHVKYDIESLRKYADVIQEGTEVEITEKIHGANSRFVFEAKTGQLHVGSHTRRKKQDPKNLWWRVAERYRLAEALAAYPDHVFYGETFGQVQDLKYGAQKDELFLAVFDIMKDGRWLYAELVHEICRSAGLPYVPILYRGPWHRDLCSYADGPSTFPHANHLREGCVVKPAEPAFDPQIGRVILKLVSVDYLGRKSK